MGSFCGTSSGSEGDLQAVLDQKKRKRMQSNRESARRSRMRKQKHLDDLTAEMNQVKKENSQILTTLNFTTHHYVAVEAENSVLRTQMMELTSRLNSLNEILQYLNLNSVCGESQMESFINPWSVLCLNQSIMASSDINIQY